MAKVGGVGRSCSSSYSRTTLVVVCVNLVAALYVLRSLYTSYYIFSSSASGFDDVSTYAAPTYTDEQIEKMNEFVKIRKAAKPGKLVKMVSDFSSYFHFPHLLFLTSDKTMYGQKAKKLKKQFLREEIQWALPQPVKQKLSNEILQKLKRLDENATTDVQKEVLEKWRMEKLDEVRRLASEDTAKSSSMPLQEAKSLQRVLESDWLMLLEDVGWWMPEEIINKKTNETEEELEEEFIIAGPPLPPECHAEIHTDYNGAAVRWGLTHHKETAADCCKACLDQAKHARPSEMKCNIWVYCPSEIGCFSPDKYVHKHQECWLKQDATPTLNFKERYSESYRAYHPTAPLIVPWMSGVVG